ncbi:MAG: arginine--tRNA ligase [Anaerohalosphaeraceae bacterium]|nr:arginine--tRNA ligase [Anaerohalosphaeraceae bacterium]
MKNLTDILSQRISQAMEVATGQNCPDAMVTAAKDVRFGDYQSNGVMALAKKLKTNPRELAQKVIAELQIDDICEGPEIAGPGFINLRLKTDFLAKVLLEINSDTKRLGIEQTEKKETVVVDFSGPNIAKQMHVGHLRSTIIGDCICRLLKFAGHNVIRQNHIGDWGTSLGKVILGLWHMCMDEKRHNNELYYTKELQELKSNIGNKEKLEAIGKRILKLHNEDWLADFEGEKGNGEIYFLPFLKELKGRKENKLWDKIIILYQYVNLLEESVDGMNLKTTIRKKNDGQWEYPQIPYESLSRHITTMLQEIDKIENGQEKEAWELITKISLKSCETIYERLRVNLTSKDECGESFYRNKLASVVEELQDLKLAVESDGAICVFPDKEKFKNKDGEPLPFIIQKSDGAFLYATTDLAAIKYRINELKAERIIYVTDARQKLHFEMLFAVARKAGWASDDIKLEHVTFGSVMGEDGRPFKTRSGENVKLAELLDEAGGRARSVVEEKNPDLPAEQKIKIANAVGIGAIKYADYSNNRTSDYVFSFDRMLAMEGNTAPYMQYAYARVKSIERKAAEKGIDFKTERANCQLNLSEPQELELAKHLARYSEAFEIASADYKCNFITSYLYELAQKFSSFYNACPVVIAEKAQRPTRLLLCDLTARTIQHGLNEFLGISVIEKM